MTTHETYVSLETAKLLKEVGFDWGCTKAYFTGWGDNFEYGTLITIEGELGSVIPEDALTLAPTLAVAQRWLREVKSFMVETTFITDEYSILYQANLYEVVSEKAKERVSELISVVRGQSELKRTYEEAQEEGIKKCLELILQNEKDLDLGSTTI